MPNPHPPLSAFPVVLLTLVLCVEALSFFSKIQEKRFFYQCCSRKLMLFSALVLPLTLMSGYYAASRIPLNDHELVLSEVVKHEALGKGFLFIFYLTLLLQHLSFAKSSSVILRRMFQTSLLLSFGFSVITSAQGGSLVFDFAVGVQKEASVAISEMRSPED